MSLFKKPSWAKSQPVDDSDDDAEVNLFSHSSRSYREIVAEQERKKQAKIERKKEKEQRRSSGKHRVKEEPNGESSTKRRRISVEDDEEQPIEATKTDFLDVQQLDDDDDMGKNQVEQKPVRRSPRKNLNSSRAKPVVVELGESDSDERNHIVHTAPAPPAEAQVIEDESDDEFAELARRARQQRQQKEEANRLQTPDTTSGTQIGNHAASSDRARLPTPDEPDPTISILITSRIPNTNPLIVQRKLSQRLQEIRQVWCMKQGFTPEATKDVFFVHRMHRVYDVTKCKSLGLDVDPFGNVTMKGAEGVENVDKVHLEAVTSELFEELKAEREKERKRRSAGEQPEDSAEDGAKDELEEPKEESLIRLVMKAKGKEELKLKVKPTTLISKIIAAYCKSRSINSQSVFLEFDGERLDPENAVQDTEIDDMDCIDVHIS